MLEASSGSSSSTRQQLARMMGEGRKRGMLANATRSEVIRSKVWSTMMGVMMAMAMEMMVAKQ